MAASQFVQNDTEYLLKTADMLGGWRERENMVPISSWQYSFFNYLISYLTT